jgi:hypothetical protein
MLRPEGAVNREEVENALAALKRSAQVAPFATCIILSKSRTRRENRVEAMFLLAKRAEGRRAGRSGLGRLPATSTNPKFLHRQPSHIEVHTS